MIRRAVARTYLRFSRWRVRSLSDPAGRPGILIGAPHTSNWDFVLMLAVTWDAGLQAHFLGKHTLFGRGAGPLMRALGGIPVDRRAPTRVVGEIVDRVRAGEELHLVVTPEGTRSAGTLWKSGFYRIARETGLPVTLGYVDRTTMTIGFGPALELTGDVVADMDRVRAFYADKVGHTPANRTEPRLREESREA